LFGVEVKKSIHLGPVVQPRDDMGGKNTMDTGLRRYDGGGIETTPALHVPHREGNFLNGSFLWGLGGLQWIPACAGMTGGGSGPMPV